MMQIVGAPPPPRGRGHSFSLRLRGKMGFINDIIDFSIKLLFEKYEFFISLCPGTQGEWAAAVATFLTALVALGVAFLPKISWYINRPRIALEYNPKPPYRHWEVYEECDIKTKKNPQVWERVKVINKGKKPAKGVKVRLMGLYQKNEEGRKEPLNYRDPITLHWAGSNDYAPRTIPPNDAEFVDVIKCEKTSQVAFFQIRKTTASIRGLGADGTYYLKLRAYSNESYSEDLWLEVIYSTDLEKNPDERLGVKSL